MKIAPDKQKHFIVGVFLGLAFQGAAWWLIPGHVIAGAIASFLLIFAISYGFELFSKITGHGHHDIMDAVASIIGGLLGMAIILFFQLR